MKGKRFDIRDWLVRGFMACAVILLAAALLAGRWSDNTEREALRAGREAGKRMDILEGYISAALSADKRTWTGQNDLPEDMVIYRYIDDTLQSWSNQFPVRNDDISSRIVIPKLSRPTVDLYSPLAGVTQDVSFVNYGQKWYLIKAETLGTRKVIAGLEIVDQMDNGNRNGINRHLKLGRGCSIVPLSETEGSVVTLDGKPVFKISADSLTGMPATSHQFLIWMAIGFFIIAALLHLATRRTMKSLVLVLAGIFAAIFAAYLWGLKADDSSRLFSPAVYADGQLFNSIGTVIVTSLVIVLSIGCIYVTRNDIFRRILGTKRPKLSLALYSSAISAILVAVLVFTHFMLRSIILNSNISLELYRLNDLSVFSLLVYLTIGGLLMTVPLLVQMLAPAVKRQTGLRFNLFTNGCRILTASAFALYLVAVAATLGFRKEEDRVNVWANRLSMDRDISLELDLRRIEDQIASDRMTAALAAIKNSNNIILGRIVENYMLRTAQDYDIVVELFPENEKNPAAVAYFTEMVSGGTPISTGSRFRFRRDNSGHSLYTGSFAYYNEGSGVTMMLLTVSPKSNREDKGYARLLGYSAPGAVLIPARYSYAKYSGKSLISCKGNYSYSTVLDEEVEYGIDEASDGVIRLNGYTHFVNRISEEDLVIVSRPKTENFNYVVAFLVLTLTFWACLSLLTLARNHSGKKEKNYYKSRINAAMMVALVMTMITLATVSVLFVYRRNTANLKSSMSDKVNSLQTLLQARCRFAQDYADLNTQEASGLLDEISNTMKSDITLYTTSGREFKSTTQEVFDRMLLGSRMNPEAFENIIYKNKRFYIGKEDIGDKATYFLYAPVFNTKGAMIAIMCSPFTDESFDFKSDAVLHSATVVTVFLILLLLARFITMAAVDKMFKPISEIGRRMNEVSISNLEYIIYERDDEVSRLVQAYNRMVHELYNSSKQLAEAERNKAWGTMARQVAHEIKNPLTPIKLQIQRLIRLKKNGNPVWAERFDEVSEEVLNQIDLLADTASQFSTFANLYNEPPVEINLDRLLKEEIALFDSKENITFSYMGLDDATVKGPKPQLTRVFTNIINNAIQAIEKVQEDCAGNGVEPVAGKIQISLRKDTKYGFYDIVFEDNGAGVDEESRTKLFTPAFTTKSNGTGLGLSICKSIIEKCNGEISYSKSYYLGGACFTVRYPKG